MPAPAAIAKAGPGPAAEKPLRALVEGPGCDVVPVTAADAVPVAEAQARWGKGLHPAGLNCGGGLRAHQRRGLAAAVRTVNVAAAEIIAPSGETDAQIGGSDQHSGEST